MNFQNGVVILFTYRNANPLLSQNDVEEAQKAMSKAMFAQEV